MNSNIQQIKTSTGFVYTRKNTKKDFSNQETKLSDVKIDLARISPENAPNAKSRGIELLAKSDENNFESIESTLANLKISSNGFIYKLKPPSTHSLQPLMPNIPESIDKIHTFLKRKSEENDFTSIQNKSSLALVPINENISLKSNKKTFIKDFSKYLDLNSSCVRGSIGNKSVEKSSPEGGFNSRSNSNGKMVSLRLLGCPKLPILTLKPSKNYSAVPDEEKPSILLDDYLAQLDSAYKKVYEGFEVLNLMTEFFEDVKTQYKAKIKHYKALKKQQEADSTKNLKSFSQLCTKIKDLLKTSKNTLKTLNNNRRSKDLASK
jgi:hypothetical protein